MVVKYKRGRHFYTIVQLDAILSQFDRPADALVAPLSGTGNVVHCDFAVKLRLTYFCTANRDLSITYVSKPL